MNVFISRQICPQHNPQIMTELYESLIVQESTPGDSSDSVTHSLFILHKCLLSIYCQVVVLGIEGSAQHKIPLVMDVLILNRHINKQLQYVVIKSILREIQSSKGDHKSANLLKSLTFSFQLCFQLSSHFENKVRVIMLLICPKHYHF